MQRSILTFWLLSLLLITTPSLAQTPFSEHPNVREFITYMSQTYDMDQNDLITLFNGVEIQHDVLESISSPAEFSLPWYRYQSIFLTPTRIEGGVTFWQEHADALERAEQEYGVPASIIVSIIGVETAYGANTGNYRLLDSLSTLAFEYPPRSAFFKKELEELFLLAQEENIDITELRGSYAGAMGLPQFIASSYRHYAVDFTEDGKRDLLNNVDDAIGSVANYLSTHGWIQGAPIVIPATTTGQDYETLTSNSLRPEHTIKEWEAHGVMPMDSEDIHINEHDPATFIALDTSEDETDYWLGLNNFYMITRYNISTFYAMAVYDLSKEIAAQKQAMDAGVGYSQAPT